jgi:hypothetical protein
MDGRIRINSWLSSGNGIRRFAMGAPATVCAQGLFDAHSSGLSSMT